ncbi:MAG TPA: hypothetical protein PJ986_02160 [Gammaproteobacteria bacterium]|nr:hypothetical protein [Gammaproteobacteria bacterium]
MSFDYGISRRRRWRIAALACALALPLAAEAGIKCWTNKDGVRECGNTVPPEYAQGEHVEKSKSGLVVKKQDRSRTQEEIIAERERRAAEAKAKAEAQAAAVERAKADRVLLDTFSSEDDLVLARDGQLTNVEAQVKITESHVVKLNKQLDQMIGQAADIEKRGRKVPENLAENIESVREQIEEQHAFIADKRREQDAIRAKFDADIARFRELRAERTATSN